jgi:hypothetical protein
MTINLGARFDHFNVSTPEQVAPAGRFVPARRFAPIENLPNWNDWAIRTGISYDLFGDGKTALKGNVSKYVAGESLSSTTPYNPMALKTESRSWRDLDGNGSALDANGNAQYDEIGPPRNVNFGLDNGTTRLEENFPRSYNWEQSVVLQHEVRSGLAITAGYYWRQYHNLTWTDNLLVDPDRDYTPFTFIGPTDPRLPNGGGELITMYNLAPSKLGLIDNVVKASSTRQQKYDGFEFTANARIRGGAFINGGLTTERTSTFNCDVDNPNMRRYCDVNPPFRTLFKASGVMPLPYAFQLSGVLRIQPGDRLAANYTVTSAIAGVPLTGGGQLSVALVNPGSLYAEYQNQLDLRIMRTFNIRGVRTQGLIDFYNVLNASAATTINQTYGSSWLRPQAIMNARYLRFGAQLDF